MEFGQPSPEFLALVETQWEWNPYLTASEWSAFVIPLGSIIAVFLARKAAIAVSLLLIGVAGLTCGSLYGLAGEYTLEFLRDAAKTDGDRSWIALHDTLVMIPVEGFIEGVWWSSVVTGFLWVIGYLGRTALTGGPREISRWSGVALRPLSDHARAARMLRFDRGITDARTAIPTFRP